MSRKIRSWRRWRGGRARSEPRPDRRSHANNGKKTENANQSTLDIPNEISLLVTAASEAVAHSRTSDHLTDSATRWPTSRALSLLLHFSLNLYKQARDHCHQHEPLLRDRNVHFVSTKSLPHTLLPLPDHRPSCGAHSGRRPLRRLRLGSQNAIAIRR